MEHLNHVIIQCLLFDLMACRTEYLAPVDVFWASFFQGCPCDREYPLIGSKPHTVSLASEEAQWCERGSHLNPTFPRAELQESPIGQTYPMEEGGSLAVIYQRTEEGSPAVISGGPEQYY